MWKYWYLRKAHPLPANLLEEPVIRELYRESKGIMALIVTIFFLAQRRAITSDDEDITKSVIKSVVKDNQHFVDQVLNQRNGEQQSKRFPRTVSDLDWASWRRPKSVSDGQVKSEALSENSQGRSSQNAPHSSKAKTTALKPTKKRNVKESPQSSVTDDFRVSLSANSDEGNLNGQPSNHDSPFGSTDEFN